MNKFMVGQRVLLKVHGGGYEIGKVVVNISGQLKDSTRVYSPTRGYDSEYANHNISPLPGGQL